MADRRFQPRKWPHFLAATVAFAICAQAHAESAAPPPPAAARISAYLNMPPTLAGPLPPTLSKVGAFESLSPLRAISGLVPYDLNQSFWSDGANKSRWIGVPAGKHIEFAPSGEWRFPPGTVFVKHFEMPIRPNDPHSPRVRLETRVLVCDAQGGVYGASYRWRADGSDADLVREPVTAPIDGGDSHKAQNWYFPGLEDCRVCHTQAAGGVLGVKTRQLNRPLAVGGESQLTAWRRMGLFGEDAPPIAPEKLATLCRRDDRSRSIEDRARSYLDANCSNCHRPGGVAGNFDARYDTPLAKQNLIDSLPLIDLGIDRARIISPHDVWRSLALVRVETSDRTRMPPLAHEQIDKEGAQILRQWIASLPGPQVLEPPAIAPKGGEFKETMRVVLSQPEKGAEIHYTLDGSLPGKSSPVYREPIEIKEPTTLRARVFKDGMMRSIVVQETYIVND